MKRSIALCSLLFVFVCACTSEKSTPENTQSPKEEKDPCLRIKMQHIDNIKKECLGYEDIRGDVKTINSFEIINDTSFIVADNFHKNLKIYSIIDNKSINLTKTVKYLDSTLKVDDIIYYKGYYLIHQNYKSLSTIVDSNFKKIKQFSTWEKGDIYTFSKKDAEKPTIFLAYITNTSDGSGSIYKTYYPTTNTYIDITKSQYDDESCKQVDINKTTTRTLKKGDHYSDSHDIAINKILSKDEAIYYKYFNEKVVGIILNYYSGKVEYITIPENIIPIAEQMKPSNCN
jgi:hypothetical protein